ncbi:Uncharacterised protein [Bordetella pertussis]|nr:Uncharacterised protein [Bordetella pertussis]
MRSCALRCSDTPSGPTSTQPPSCSDQPPTPRCVSPADAGAWPCAPRARRMRRARLRITELSSSRSTGLVR